MQALEEARAALEAEQAKGVKLEVELAEARQRLERMEELDRELQKYRWAIQCLWITVLYRGALLHVTQKHRRTRGVVALCLRSDAELLIERKRSFCLCLPSKTWVLAGHRS